MSSTLPPRSAPAPAGHRLARSLQRASSSAGLRTLLRRLGISVEFSPVSRVELARAELRPTVTRVARSGDTVAPLYLVELPGDAGPHTVQEVARGLHRLAAGPLLFVACPPGRRTLVLGCRAADGTLRFAPVERLHPRPPDLQLLAELEAAPEGALARLLHWSRVLERGSVGVRFFRDIRAHRDLIARGWTGVPARATAEREQLALLLLCRLLFLCFLQERGHLLGDRDFVARLIRERRGSDAGGLYQAVVQPLFFGVFNTRPDQRSPTARALGALPYLNGGLFELHALERRFARLSLPDDILLRTVAELLGRYRFTTADAAETTTADAVRSGIDPEVLGRVFEALMASPRRGDTGSFYSPPAVVDGLVSRALVHALTATGTISEAAAERLINSGDVMLPAAAARAAAERLAELRVLDPACGSGAFLLGALSRLSRARAAVEPGVDLMAVRNDIVARSLHGVDLLDDAALLCALRLWLALAPGPDEDVAPLPSLDRRIRQGDALVDPLDLVRPGAGAGPQRNAALAPEVRRLLCELEPLGQSYLHAEPEQRPALRSRLQAAEAALARAWLEALGLRLERGLREADAAAEYRDLWDQPLPAGPAARRERERLRQRLNDVEELLRGLRDERALPFFSFAVHFAAERTGFDLVVGNPPWVRAHRWPAVIGSVRERFRVCREAGWPGVRGLLTGGSGPGGQVDLALLFLERGLALLADGGTLGMLLPAKLIRSLFAGGARALLLEQTSLLELDDHSLDQHSVFAADAFTTQLICRRSTAEQPVRVTLRNRGREPLRFELAAADLPLMPGDSRAPWLLAPPPVLRVLRAMQRVGTCVGRTPGLKLRRGVLTGANDVLVIAAAEHRLGGLSRIRAQGWFRARRSGDAAAAAAHAAWIETSVLRPLVRGADVKAWRWSASQRVVWIPGNELRDGVTPPRAARYLARHAGVLRRRSGGGLNAEAGRLLRVGGELLGDKVVWQDIADDVHAAAVPARVRGDDGTRVPVIPLNTVYFIAPRDRREALLLAALLNSLPLRVFARAAAERAKDARFRFFAWTIAALPLPPDWRAGAVAEGLERISAEAHAAGGITEEAQRQLDECVAQAYGLKPAELDTLIGFDAWLKR